MTRRDIKIREIAYHRNGVAGEGFHVVLFDWPEPGARKPARHMVATVFPLHEEDGEADWNGRISVFDVDQLAAGNIAFAAGNSWRGDDFEPELRAAVTAWQTARDERWKQEA